MRERLRTGITTADAGTLRDYSREARQCQRMVRSAPVRRLLLLFFLLLVACEGGLHRRGDKMWSVRAHYGEPIEGRTFVGNGLGKSPSAGVGVYNHWFVRDRLALGLGLTPTVFQQQGDTVWGAELNGQVRWYFADVSEVGFFLDVQGGLLLLSEDLPPRGTPYNLSYVIGPGVEWAIGERWRMLGGVLFHHISNGKGIESPDNPTLNETRVWIGFGSTW